MVGAYTFASEADEKRLKLSERQTHIAGDCHIIDPPERVYSGEHPPQLLIEVPSPWHAVIHLLVNNRSWMSGEVALGRRMSLIYRGQRDSSWELQPSIQRPGVDRRRAIDAKDAFCVLSALLFQSESAYNWLLDLSELDTFGSPDFPKYVHAATAQHYGISTGFLDFSTDPAVATWFACRGSSSEDSGTASVFALPMELAAHNGVALLLPHPFVRRVYQQFGVFAEYRGGCSLRGVCVEIRFPPDPSFEVKRTGVTTELLPEDNWWMVLVEIAQAIAEEGKLNQLSTLKSNQVGIDISSLGLSMDFIGLPDFAERQNKSKLLSESLGCLENMLLHLTTEFRGAEPRVMNSGVRISAQHNSHSLHALIPLLRRRIEGIASDRAREHWRSIISPTLDAIEDRVIEIRKAQQGFS